MTRQRTTYREVKLTLVRETAAWPYSLPRALRCGNDLASLTRAFIGDDPREHFIGVYLDGSHQVIGIHRISVGTACQTTVHPREVFLPAIHLAASAIVVAHNHPSGDAAPSTEDRGVTERLKEAGVLLGIEVLDHLVLGAERYWTFADETYRAFPS